MSLNELVSNESFFHDGVLEDVNHEGNNIDLRLSSAEISQDDLITKTVLSKGKFIRGVLRLVNVKEVTVDEKSFQEKLKKTHDVGGIFRLRVTKNSVAILIDWYNYPPKEENPDFTEIEIKAEEVLWENLG